MAIVKTSDGMKNGGNINCYTQASAADTAQTCSTDGGQVERLLYITVKYSAAPTQTGVTITLNSGTDAAYDTLLVTGTANAQNTAYLPDPKIVLRKGDTLDVVAPAAGGVITSAVSIFTEAL